MKKVLILGGLISAVLVFSNCNQTKKIAATPAAKSTYEAHLSSVIMSNCSPCHIPAKGGNKKAYDNYANVKTDIDEIIRRIELNPTDRGFMPFKKAKLSDSTINAFKQWRTDGMLEK
jgi:mono/diheme cytochrome c family protein